jgi:TonB-linked SusC/RagA family outer membrane protein
MKMASTPEYLTLLNEKGTIAAKKSGGEFTPYNLANYPVSVDWFDEILRNSATVQDHHIGFSGGNENTQFALGGGYFSQEGLMRSHFYERVNLRTSVESKVRKYLKVGLNANFSGSYTNNSPNVAHDAFVAPPPIPVIDPETGYYNALTEFGDYNNPMVSLVYNNNKTQGIRLVASAFAELYLFKNLTFKSSYGVDGSFIRDRIYLPKYTLNRKGGEPYVEDREQLERKMTYSVDSYWDNTLTYTKEFGGGHNLTALAGISAQEQKSLWMSAARLHVPQAVNKNGRLLNTTLYLNLGDPGSQANDDGGSHVASFSWFGRINYAYKEKYLVTGTVRRDGSSIFPSENRYDIFPSVGLGWILSNEDFMKGQRTFQNLKIRASWGEMGNNKIPELTAVSTVDYGNWNSSEFGGTIYQGASATYIGPASLLWEKTREYDLALEGITVQSKLSFELDFYHKKTLGAIFPVTVNSALGASNTSFLDNNADVVNKGVELSLSWKNRYRELNYRIGGNVTVNDNEVVSLRPGTIGIYGGYMNVVSSTYTTIGHPIGEFYGRKVLGIFQNDTEIADYKNQEGTPIQPDAQPGDFKYEDINKDGVINDKDRSFLGTALPTFNYALNFYFEYKGVDLVVDLYGQGGNHIYNAKRFRQIGNENYDKDFYDHRWHGEGTSTTYPSADLASSDNKAVNSWSIEKGNFFRIQNVQLGYTLPESITSKLGTGTIRLFANATNPFTFFKYKGFSPEIIKTGAESATNQGVDSYVYPMSATYNFGVNINL